MVRKVAFTVYRKWYDQIAAGCKNIEYREIKAPWTHYLVNPPEEAVFLCGRYPPIRRKVTGVVVFGGLIEFHLLPGAR